MLVVLVLCISASVGMAQVPNISAANGNVCTGITVTPAFDASTQHVTYSITIAPDATFNGISVLGIKALAIYPNEGASSTVFPNSGNVVATKPSWNGIDYTDAGTNGFGFKTNAPVNYVPPSGISTEIGWAIYNSGLPSKPVYLVHVVQVGGNSGFCRLDGGENPPVPEPATMALLLPGLIPLAGILRKKRN